MPAVSRLLPPIAVIGGVAALARVLTGPGYLGYDAVWALLWGRQLSRFEVPDFESAVAPTPHPLANLIGALFSPLGTEVATDLTIGLAYLALGGLAWSCWRLGSVIAGAAVGAAFAVIAVTRPTMVLETTQVLIDVPFLWVVMAALALEAERSRRGMPVLALFGVAGLLRPEGWLLAGAYALWLMVAEADWNARARIAAAAAAAPLVWMAFDLAATGDPLHSLHGTQELAAELGRPREFDTALAATPFYLRETLGSVVTWIGLAGVLAAMATAMDRTFVPLAAAAIGMLAFLALGLADLPLLTRYLLLPALVLALFAAVAVLGWTHLGREHRSRVPWMAAGGVLGAIALASIPGEVRRMDRALDFSRTRSAIQRELETIADRPEFRAAGRACPGLVTPDHRPVPLLAWWLDRSPDTIDGSRDAPVDRAVVLAYANPVAAGIYSVDKPPPAPGLPPGTRAVATSRSWLAGSSC